MTRPDDKALLCPFCGEDDFDEIGLCLHLSMHCPQYDRACRRTSDYIDSRIDGLGYPTPTQAPDAPDPH